MRYPSPNAAKPRGEGPDGRDKRSRRPTEWALVGGIAAGVIALGGTVAIVAMLLTPPGDQTSTSEAPRQSDAAYAAPSPLPPEAEVPAPGAVGRADPDWVRATAQATGIPERALAAYAGAALFKSTDRADCGIGWNHLAAIGLIESDHGRYGGSTIATDGTTVPPIYGIALDGNGVASIPDSDGGTIDGDATHDRAVGPMQIIPGTWRNWHVDGNSDGVEDPQNIDDAVIAASNYLCRSSPDMVDEDGWRAGIHAYNRSDAYAHSVADAANRYDEAAATVAFG
ncbi:lytic transglycosylase domain-containing protein [Salinibacterium hongtaonis]|uniref:lytic transglycosylase domain-containing protein n=1 Tax=Homoserinimonas hongtaonis TaxID=2079791 RepID=UPI001E369DED|nr:lytic transglycosylase domain-containing protein [Salinibacterium hongtaonis]